MVLGRHLIADMSGCDEALLRDEHGLIVLFENALRTAGVHILARTSHKFSGEGGVTGIFLLSESHTSFHSYPEFGYIAVDIFTCGMSDPELVMSYLRKGLSATNEDCQVLSRGGILTNFPDHKNELKQVGLIKLAAE